MLNQAARYRLAQAGELGADVEVETDRGRRRFADNDRILFLRNERDLGVKNGTLGTIEKATSDRLAVQLDDGRRIAIEFKTYASVDHGYAVTIHKAQGMTVDQAHVLATPGLDAHGAYVSLSRHRSRLSLHYGRNDFADEAALARTLSRERPKDMALDYGPRAARTLQQDSEARTALKGPAETDRASTLRAMVAARVKAAANTVARVRRMAHGAGAVARPPRGREHDHGAER
jgi:ATP-dependent exoDNAse (exonuclease V) alpha subunit